MAERKPLVVVNGQVQELPAGDTLPPFGNPDPQPVITLNVTAGGDLEITVDPLTLTFRDATYYSGATQQVTTSGRKLTIPASKDLGLSDIPHWLHVAECIDTVNGGTRLAVYSVNVNTGFLSSDRQPYTVQDLAVSTVNWLSDIAMATTAIRILGSIKVTRVSATPAWYINAYAGNLGSRYSVKQHPPAAAIVNKLAVQAIPHAVVTKLTGYTGIYNAGGVFNASASTFTAVAKGLYDLRASVAWYVTLDAMVRIHVNGVFYTQSSRHVGYQHVLNTLAYLQVGDVIEFYVYQTSGAPQNTVPCAISTLQYTYASVRYISEEPNG